MIDTVRTETDLLNNLFQDSQAVSSITANDMRDLIVSIKTLTPPSFATLSHNLTQTVSIVDTPTPILLNTNDSIENITHSIAVSTEEITIINAGVYAIFAGLQIEHIGGGTSSISSWVQEDTGAGFVNVANSAVRQDLSNNNTRVLFLNHIGRHAVGDKIRLMWMSTNLNGELISLPSVNGASLIPSVIVTIEQTSNG